LLQLDFTGIINCYNFSAALFSIINQNVRNVMIHRSWDKNRRCHDTQDNGIQHNDSHHHDSQHIASSDVTLSVVYAERCICFIVILIVAMSSVIMLSVLAPNTLSVFLFNNNIQAL